MLDLEQADSVRPICPHCNATLSRLLYQGLRGLLGRRFIYFCPDCHKILGVSHRKGFWMG